MKLKSAVMIAGLVFSSYSFASPCSMFQGSFVDAARTEKQILKFSADCQSLSWQSGDEAKTILTDGIERKLSSEYVKFDLFIKAELVDGKLILNQRLQEVSGLVLSEIKSVYTVSSGDRIKLTEMTYLIEKDFAPKLIVHREFFQVH